MSGEAIGRIEDLLAKDSVIAPENSQFSRRFYDVVSNIDRGQTDDVEQIISASLGRFEIGFGGLPQPVTSFSTVTAFEAQLLAEQIDFKRATDDISTGSRQLDTQLRQAVDPLRQTAETRERLNAQQTSTIDGFGNVTVTGEFGQRIRPEAARIVERTLDAREGYEERKKEFQALNDIVVGIEEGIYTRREEIDGAVFNAGTGEVLVADRKLVRAAREIVVNAQQLENKEVALNVVKQLTSLILDGRVANKAKAGETIAAFEEANKVTLTEADKNSLCKYFDDRNDVGANTAVDNLFRFQDTVTTRTSIARRLQRARDNDDLSFVRELALTLPLDTFDETRLYREVVNDIDKRAGILRAEAAIAAAAAGEFGAAGGLLTYTDPTEIPDIYKKIIPAVYAGELDQKYLAGIQIAADDTTKPTQQVEISTAFVVRPDVPNVWDSSMGQERQTQLRHDAQTVLIERYATDTLAAFGNRPAADIDASILTDLNTPETAELAKVLIERLEDFVICRRLRLATDYEYISNPERRTTAPSAEGEGTAAYDFDQGLGRNEAAYKYLLGQFGDVIAPMFQTMRGRGSTAQVFNYLRDKEDFPKRSHYVIDVETLRAQRDLTEIEEAYLRSVADMSTFNPYLVAMAKEAPGEFHALLDAHFADLDVDTEFNLEDDDYVPAVIVGTGPHGLIAAGEMVRTHPDVAAKALYVDTGKKPGGVFAVPNGPAFRANSANKAGEFGYVLPDTPGPNEAQTVRAFGSPLRWYPGERRGDKRNREGSINTIVDWLPQADEFSVDRYVTNEAIELVCKAQAAMVLKRVLLKTRVVSQEETDDDEPGKFRVFLERTFEDGTTDVRTVRTDYSNFPTGLGEKRRDGVQSLQSDELKGANQRAIEAGKFPLVTDALTAYRLLADRQMPKKPMPGDVVAFMGGRNSAEVGVEGFTSLAATGGNNGVRNVDRIFVISPDGKFVERPRYAGIGDVLPRPGEAENIVTVKPGRVTSLETRIDGEDGKEKVVIGITEANGSTSGLVVDHAIDTTGFESVLGSILAPERGEKRLQNTDVAPITLPTNPAIIIADRLRTNQGTTVISGVASRPSFNEAKLAQLPARSRTALEKVGVANAVALGFRGQDTQATARLTLDETFGSPKERDQATTLRALTNDERPSPTYSVQEGALPPISRREAEGFVPRNDVRDETVVLSGLMALKLARARVVTGDGEAPFSGEYVFRFKRTGDENFWDVESPILSGVVTRIANLIEDPAFAGYAKRAIERRGSDTPGLRAKVVFRNGRLVPSLSNVIAE